MSLITSTRTKIERSSADTHPFYIDVAIIFLLNALSVALRIVAALHTGTEVDEPIYRSAAIHFLHYGFPAVRPPLSQPVIPFLYHPPFALMLLGEWFRACQSETLLTGRVFSILCSSLVLTLLYFFLLRAQSRTVALIACLLIVIDPWLIFTNQAIYLENSQMIFCVLFAWSYWYASASDEQERLKRYIVAGVFLGLAIIWKHIGGFLIISVLAHFLLQRRHLRGHLALMGVALTITGLYVIAMHCWFGEIYDHATMVQINRTLWNRYSPGLNYSPLDALRVIYSHYYIFPVTIAVLVGGAMLAIVQYIRYFLHRRPLSEGNPVVLCWALGGLTFAALSALKSPHYMILWLIPLYTFVAIEVVARLRSSHLQVVRSGLLCCAIVMVSINAWSFHMRFLRPFGDTLVQADSYINQHIPDNAVIISQDYFGVDIQPRYINITGITRSDQALNSSASYIALYWSTTEPLSAPLQTIHKRCQHMATFSGFKDHVEICRLHKGHDTTVVNSPSHGQSGHAIKSR